MALNRKRFELILLGLYFVVTVVGTSMEAIMQILAH